MSKKTETFTELARQRVQDKIDRDEKNRHIVAFRQRMEVARAGVMFYQAGKYKEALENYYKYLAILERFKKVKSGQLTIKDFDSKRDVAELLLLSGIYWDIAKLQDRSKKKDRVQIKLNLDKFINFSKGMPYQNMCAELMRKYLMNDRPIHRTMFKETYAQLGGGKCFVATAVEDFCAEETLPALRMYRDEVLLKKTSGKAFVRFYYLVGPTTARVVLRTPEFFQRNLARFFDRIAEKVSKNSSILK